MSHFIFDYYQKESNKSFEDIIVLDKKTSSFEDLQKKTFNFPKAWSELIDLNKVDRVEFSRDFCLKTLPYSPRIYQLIYDFFLHLEDIYIVMTKEKKQEKYFVELVYKMKKSSSIFRGRPPLKVEEISIVNRQFKDILPRDFLAFLKVHNGFAKNFDTGIIDAKNILNVTNQMREIIEREQKVITCNKKVVDPKDLIFFYQSYQTGSFQCFYILWFPFSEMGNVHFSLNDNSISNFHNKDTWAETMAFATFLDWLMFYLEIMDVE